MRNPGLNLSFPTIIACIIFLAGCAEKNPPTEIAHVNVPANKTAPDSLNQTEPVQETVPLAARKEIPILCYHRISNTEKIGDYTVSIEAFREQMKSLADSGYHTVLPDQLYEYVTKGAPLPSKPVMITFDDTRVEHATIAGPVMEKLGFRGVFFVMTVSINRPNYMTTEQIRSLAAAGHAIESHTYDHQNMKKLPAEEWEKQVVKPALKLESITGKPVRYFAYPFGLWNEQAVSGLKKYGIRAAFQLSEKKSSENPVFSIRRILVPGQWSTKTMHKNMKNTFRSWSDQP